MEESKNYTIEQIQEMEEFITRFINNQDIDEEDDTVKAKYKNYVEALCSINNITGLRTKAYACYGDGNSVYSCDWKLSEECLLKMIELENDPWAANTLGYIYYYGRTTDSVPNYDKAFKYFSVAALYGIYEAIYKIADMCLSGKGLPMRCLSGAENIIDWLYYHEVKPNFITGATDNELADVALRMGRIYLEKYKEKKLSSTDAAYGFFLEAEHALKFRDNYGDTVVMSNIRKGLEEARENLSFKDLDQNALEKKAVLKMLERLNSLCRVSIKRAKGSKKGIMTIHFPEHIYEGYLGELVVLPEIDYCGFVKKIKIDIDGIKKLKIKKNKFTCDYCYINNGTVYFCNYEVPEKVCCKLKANSFNIRRENCQKSDDIMHKLVSVAFDNRDRLYDYLYELDMPVAEGDYVVVSGYNGYTTVTVKKVSIVSEKELALPLTRYKKIVGKAESQEDNVHSEK